MAVLGKPNMRIGMHFCRLVWLHQSSRCPSVTLTESYGEYLVIHPHSQPNLTTMAAATMTATQPVDCKATMEYIRADSKMNRRYMAAGAEVSTGRYETRDVFVHDIRSEANKYTLEKTGFQLFNHSSNVSQALWH